MAAVVSVEPLREVAREAGIVSRRCFRVLQDVHDSLGRMRHAVPGATRWHQRCSLCRGILREGKLRDAETAPSRNRVRRSKRRPWIEMMSEGWPAIRSSFAYSGSPPTLANYLASYGGHPSPEP